MTDKERWFLEYLNDMIKDQKAMMDNNDDTEEVYTAYAVSMFEEKQANRILEKFKQIFEVK